ncbi:hypothetical protein KI387_004020, partial [Taxus chinensis]
VASLQAQMASGGDGDGEEGGGQVAALQAQMVGLQGPDIGTYWGLIGPDTCTGTGGTTIGTTITGTETRSQFT